MYPWDHTSLICCQSIPKTTIRYLLLRIQPSDHEIIAIHVHQARYQMNKLCVTLYMYFKGEAFDPINFYEVFSCQDKEHVRLSSHNLAKEESGQEYINLLSPCSSLIRLSIVSNSRGKSLTSALLY